MIRISITHIVCLDIVQRQRLSAFSNRVEVKSIIQHPDSGEDDVCTNQMSRFPWIDNPTVLIS